MQDGNKVEIKHIKQSFPIKNDTLEVLRDINIDLEPGEFVTIVGQSGCGKSTLLRIVAGLDQPTGGEVLIGGEKVQGTSLNVGVLFQESRLLPWYNVEKNIDYGLVGNYSKKERKDRIRQLVSLVGLEGFEEALPEQLSGGMQKRVAIARTLANHPQVLLLDEPFGALDAFTKMNLQKELLKIWQKEKMTTLMVTHDIDEAIYLGQRVIVMSPKPGVIKKKIKIDLPSDRSRTSPEFDQYRREIFTEFFGEQNHQPEYVI